MGFSSASFAASKDASNAKNDATAKVETPTAPAVTPAQGQDDPQQYFWYTPDGSSSLGHGVDPSTGCTAVGDDCAKGYINQPLDPVHDPAQTTRAEDQD